MVNEWVRDHSSVDYGFIKPKQKGKPTTTYKGLKDNGNKVGDRNIPTSIRRFEKWGVKTGWVLHCFDDLTRKRVSIKGYVGLE